MENKRISFFIFHYPFSVFRFPLFRVGRFL
jgi:hypothetical protein